MFNIIIMMIIFVRALVCVAYIIISAVKF